MLELIIVIILVFALLGAVPTWGHSKAWGYGPSGLLGVLLVIILIVILLRHL